MNRDVVALSPAWRKSSRCESNQCVEFADLGGTAAMRNTTRPDVVLTFPGNSWTSFIAGVRAGEFDRS
jgi:uncharacterized protein DUF397